MSHAFAGSRSGFGQFDPPGFARHLKGSASNSKTGKSKNNPIFTPTEAQVTAAAGCLVGCLKKVNGHYTGRAAQLSGLLKELQPSIFARGHRFGRTPSEVHTTLVAAYGLLKRQGAVQEVTDSQGRYGIALKNWSPNRKHKDKYTNRSPRNRRGGLAA